MILPKRSLRSTETQMVQPLEAIPTQPENTTTVKRGNRRNQPNIDTVERAGIQLSVFQFYEMGYKAPLDGPDLFIQLKESFRKEIFREPMRLLAALPRLSVLERRLYWLVLTALKNYQYMQQASPNTIPLIEQKLIFTFHKSRLRASESTHERGDEISVVEVKKTLSELAGKTIKWENAKGDAVNVNMFDTLYRSGEGMMVLELNPKLTEAFLKLGNDFAQGTLQTAMLLESQYAQLLYSYLARARWRGKWRISLVDLKNLLGATSKAYDRYWNFISRVLKGAVDEINRKGDFHVEYNEINKHMADMALLFTITSQKAFLPPKAGEAPSRLRDLLTEIDTMSISEKLQFASSTILSYYSGFQAWQREKILTDQHVLDRFLRADAYVETGMVSQGKHEAYVAKAAFQGARQPVNKN